MPTEHEYQERIKGYISQIAINEEISRAIELEIGARELKGDHPEFTDDLNPHFAGTSTTMLNYAQKGLMAEHHELYTKLASATYNSSRESGHTLQVGLSSRDAYPLNHSDYDGDVVRFASDGIPLDHVTSYDGLPAVKRYRMLRLVSDVVYTHLRCIEEQDEPDAVEYHEAVMYRTALRAKKAIPVDSVWDKGVRIVREDVHRLLGGTGYINQTADMYYVAIESDNTVTISSPLDAEWGVHTYAPLSTEQMERMSDLVKFEV